MHYECMMDFRVHLFESINTNLNWKSYSNVKYLFQDAIMDKIDLDSDRLHIDLLSHFIC